MRMVLLTPALLAALTMARRRAGAIDRRAGPALRRRRGPDRPGAPAADFGGLCRYDSENAHLPPATSRRVILFGDSITELWKLRDPALFTGDVLDRASAARPPPRC